MEIDRLKTQVTYIPIIQPEAPSPAQQTAQREGTWAPGPADDPDGWDTLSPLFIPGVFKDSNEIVKYTVRFILLTVVFLTMLIVSLSAGFNRPTAGY